ncbi:hypothetical protein HNQ02_002924, partial [Flavobacterium sp. 7E]|nr:hypothetical protein [Flavobacterium sp. 7E]
KSYVYPVSVFREIEELKRIIEKEEV